MKQTVVKATVGREQGSRSSRRLRAEGQLPGVVYGLGQEPKAVAVAYKDLRDALKEGGPNAILSLESEGDSELVLVYDLQRDPIKRAVTHVDFLRVDRNAKVTVSIPIEVVGEPEKVLDAGGFIDQQRFELEVSVSPMSIPEKIEVDVSELEMDDRIAVGDLNLPAGVESLVDEEISVVTTALPALEEVEETEEEGVEGEEGAEGEEASGDASEDGDADSGDSD